MDLVTSLSAQELLAITASIAVMMSIYMADTLNAFFASPPLSAFLNATSVVLKNTEVVWRPVLLSLAPIAEKAIQLLKPVLKILVKVILFLGNLTVSGLSSLKEMGGSVSVAVSAFFSQISDIGKSLIVIGKAMTSLFLYTVSAVETILVSFQEVFAFVSRLVFQTHTVTLDDLYNISIPFVVVLSVVGFLMWSMRKPSPVAKTIILRRSSRLERKRAMLSCGDFNSFASSSSKPSTRTTNL